MGLYDGYQLVNSRSIPEYKGSIVPEMVQVSQELQNRYNTSQNNIDYATQFLNSLDANDTDKPELQKLRDKYLQSLKAISGRKDLENATRETTMLAQQLPQDYMGFAQNMKARSAYKEELEKQYEKGDIKNRATIDKLIGLSDQMSGAIKIDPATGRYKTNYRGYTPAKELDKNKFIDDALAHANPSVIGSKGTIFSKDGKWLIDEEGKTRSLTAAEVDKIAQSAMQNSEEWKSYMRQERLLGTFNNNYKNLRPEDISIDLSHPLSSRLVTDGNGKPVLDRKGKAQYVPITVKDILESKMRKGKDLGQAYKELQEDLIEKQHTQDALNYARKYVVNEKETREHYRENPYGLKDYENRESNRFLIPGAEIQLEEKDKDLSSLSESIKSIDQQINDKKNSLNASLPADEKMKIQQEIQVLEDRKLAKETISKGAGDAVAFKLSGGIYKTEQELLEATKGKQSDLMLPKKGDKWLLSGKTIKDVQLKDSYMGGNQYEITFEDGSKTTMVGPAAKNIQSKSDRELRDKFYTAKQAEIKTNASKYAFHPMDMSLSENESKELKQQVLGKKSDFQWFKTGNLSEPLKQSDVNDIKDFNLTSISLIHKNGSYYLKGYAKATDAKHKGEPGDNYTLQITPGSNVGKTIASNILSKKGSVPSSDMIRSAAILSGKFKFSGDIASLQDREPLTIRDNRGNVFATLKREPYNNTEGTRYVLYDSKGNAIPGYSTSDLSEADEWLSQALYKSLNK